MNDTLTPTHATNPAGSSTRARYWTVARVLLTIGAAGPVLFLVFATVAGLLTPGYNPLRQPISELVLDPMGWIQTANFYVFGLAIVAFAVGLFRSLPRPSWVGSVLLIICGAGMFAAGVFPTDAKGASDTGTGAIHNLLFLLIFLTLMVAYVCSALSFRTLDGWRGYTWATALMPVVVFGLLFVLIGFGSDSSGPLYAIGGLIQRLLIAVAFGWMTVTARRLV